MLTIDNRIQHIYGIRALASVAQSPAGAIRPALDKTMAFASSHRPDLLGRKGAS
jgi:hypothetical protein